MKKVVVIVFFALVVPLVVSVFLRHHSLSELVQVVHSNTELFALAVLMGKMASIVYPPLPGTFLTFGSIPFVGWKVAYGIDFVGSLSGSTAAYFLGKRYGITLLSWLFGPVVLQSITTIKLKDRNQIESTLFLKTTTGGVLSDALAWGASLIKLQYLPFIIGHMIAHLLITLPVFYLLSLSIEVKSLVFVVPIALIGFTFLYFFKGRYFE